MLRLLFASRKVRALMEGLLASILSLILGHWIGSEAAIEIANAAAALIISVAAVYALGVAIEDAGTKAGGRDPAPPGEEQPTTSIMGEPGQAMTIGRRPDLGGFPRPPSMPSASPADRRNE